MDGDNDLFEEGEEEGDHISGTSFNGKQNYNNTDKETIDSDELSSQSSTIIGTINTQYRNEMNEPEQSKKDEGIKNTNEEEILNLFNNKEGDQIQINQSNKISKEELIKSNWIVSNHLLDICAKYNSKDSNVMLLLHANGIVLLFAYVNIWIWVFFVLFVLLKI